MSVYLEHNGQQFGPFELAQALGYIAEGRFSATDRAWMDGMADWQDIGQIADLARALPRAEAAAIVAAPMQAPSPSPQNPYGAPAQNPNPYGAPQSPYQPAAPAYPGGASPYAPPQAPLYYHHAVPSDPEFAGFWRRAAALTIDYMLLYIALMFVSFFVGLLSALTGSPELIMGLTLMVVLVMYIGYFVVWNCSSHMATIGKMAMGCIVVDGEGRPLSMGASIARETVKMISSFILYLLHFTQPFTSRRQTIYDLMSGSVVLRRSADAGAPGWLVWIINALWVLIFVIFTVVALYAIGQGGF